MLDRISNSEVDLAGKLIKFDAVACGGRGHLVHPAGVNPHSKPPADVHSEEFLHLLMRRQLRLSIACASAFLIALLTLPLLNYFLPDLMATRVFGFTLTWLVLGVLFFPLVWTISWLFIRRSIALEEAEVNEVKRGDAQTPGAS